MPRILALIFTLSACFAQQLPTAPRLIRSQSGPSGKVVGSQFVLDETRNRFVYPQDRGLVISFEWQTTPGEHTLTGSWKDPSGKVVYIAADLRIQTETSEIRGYWNYDIYDTTPAGIWTLEIRMDGQPAGSHSFELVVPAPPAVSSGPTPNDIYKASLPSLVWVHKLDGTGRRLDTSTGFVWGQDRIATAFQAVDASDRLEIEFADGRRVQTSEIWAADRLQDWALVKADTRNLPALPRDPQAAYAIGDHYLVFNVEVGMNRAFGTVDISGTRRDAMFGDRIQIAPPLAAETAGGPLFAMSGKVVGLLGGSVIPGSRFDARSSAVPASPYWALTSVPGGAIPLRLLRDSQSATTLWDLEQAKILTPPLQPTENFEQAHTGKTPPKGSKDYIMENFTQYSRRDSITVMSRWRKREKDGKGAIGAHVYDAQNRVVVNVAPKKMSLSAESSDQLQFDFTFPDMPRGSYRVDIEWDGRPTWRTFLTISD